MFDPSALVSDRTTPALSTVMLQRPACRKIWVDAFCVPGTEYPAERAATLESMGFIYSQAEEVLVVLTADARPALERMHNESPLLRIHLDLLEKEDWVTRAWTYQEAVNAKRLRISCHGAPAGTIIDCLDFISSVGEALNQLSPQDRNKYPQLNSFEDVMVDCVVAGYLQRSALQVMSIMDGRTQTWPDDHFYAMIGAISTEPAAAVGRLSPCEAFMSLCERKGDYSFIFSSAPRDTRPGRRWRPLDAPDLPAILKLSGTGSGLRGRLENGVLILEDVLVMKQAPVSLAGKAFIAQWLAAPGGFNLSEHGPDLELEEMAFQALKDLGFSGSSKYLTTGSGLFFPQVRIPPCSLAGVELLVAAGIPWRLGAPALARCSESPGDETVLYVPGVFFGNIFTSVHRPITVILD